MKNVLFTILAALAVLSCQSDKVRGGISFDEVVASRRSIRHFDASKTISEAEVRTLLSATQEAPSWMNLQPNRYYVAMSPEKLSAVREAIGERNAKNTEGVNVYIVTSFVRGQSGYFRGNVANELGDAWGAHDNGLGNAFLLLKARAMGFDTLLMGGRDGDALRSIFNIPEEETVMAVIAVGYRATDPQRPNRKSFDEIVKFY
ncbi:MAG: nitroreductase family protein [Bacteroidales bacterium]|nr:nitroreductase family protein [Bacteroidales bacterium]